jgi:uncharacterized protein YdaU (DUF1376 family)
MPKPHWFPFYVSDFLSSPTVTLMTAEEVGGYLLLLCYAWQDPKGSLPHDDESLRVLSRVRSDLSRIKSCFKEKNGRLYNGRLTQELEKAQEKSDAAKKSNAMRWHSERNANAMRTQSSSQSESESQLDKKEKKKSMPLRATVLVDSEWITALGKNPAYQHINLTVEIGKMEAWLALPKNTKRFKTRSFVLNWLNKIEAPMQGGNGKSKPPPFPPKGDPIARGQWRQTYGKPEDYGYV